MWGASAEMHPYHVKGFSFSLKCRVMAPSCHLFLFYELILFCESKAGVLLNQIKAALRDNLGTSQHFQSRAPHISLPCLQVNRSEVKIRFEDQRRFAWILNSRLYLILYSTCHSSITITPCPPFSPSLSSLLNPSTQLALDWYMI
jgi:hypothetical protein